MNDNDKDPSVSVSAPAAAATDVPVEKESLASAVAATAAAAPSQTPVAVQSSRSLAPSALMLTAGIFLYGLAGSLLMRVYGLTDVSENAPGIYFYLYTTMEPLVMFAMLALCVLFAIFIDNKTRVPEVWPQRADGAAWGRLVYVLLPLLVLGVTLAGTFSVMHNYAFGPEEYLTEFQAEALTRGSVAVPVPVELQWLDTALKPNFVTLYANEGGAWWVPSSLSGYALIRSGFLLMLGAPWLTGPLFSAASVMLIALISRMIWKHEPNGVDGDPASSPLRQFAEVELLAAALLAVSSQMLLTGMTAFAMPAYLFLNLLWLWLFLRNTTQNFVLACVVGFCAMAIQEPMMHFCFALPLLFRLVLQKRWQVVAGFAAFYAVALWYVCSYLGSQYLPPGMSGHVAATTSLEPVDAWSFYLRTLTFPLFFSWQALPVTVLAVTALCHWRKLPPVVRDLSVGFLLVYVYYFATHGNQGHGWGYRYCYAVLGNVVLLAVAGWPWFAASAGRSRAGLFVAFGLATALAFQLPYRAWSAEQVVRPFALSSESLRLHQERFVMLDARYKWYGDDLIRNGPFFDKPTPIIVRTQSLKAMNPENLAVVLDQLKRLGSIKLVKSEDLTPYGMTTLSEGAMRAKGFLNRDGSAADTPKKAAAPAPRTLPANRSEEPLNSQK